MIRRVIPVVWAMLAAVITAAAPSFAAEPDLTFKPSGDGWFTFDTGMFKGKLCGSDKSQGIPTFIDAKTGRDLAYGGGNPGILSFYRMFSAAKRWGDPDKGDTFRGWPKTARCLPDGAAEIRWPPADDHPVEMTATYRWQAADTLDLATVVKPTIGLPEFEVFLSSYFGNAFKNYVYVQSPRHAPGKPYFLVPEGNPLVRGTYQAYPRDLKAARMMYDGRWEQGHSPVQWSVTRFLASPIGLMHDAKSDITFVQMARPEECFAMEMPYHMAKPDGVAGHHSMYFSLFGGDLAAGKPVQTSFRMVIGRQITQDKALKLYKTFLDDTK